jgi:hypothetical protein
VAIARNTDPQRQTRPGTSRRSVGCGLRRRELAELTLDLIQRRQDRPSIVGLAGKAGHIAPFWFQTGLSKLLTTGF